MSNKSKEKNSDKKDDIAEYSFKILTIGDMCVGKTSIMRRYVENIFSSQYLSTIGIDYLIKSIKIDDKKIKLKVYDTAGQERYRNITTHAFKEADGIALIFDITNESSFNQITDWMEQIQTNTNKDEISLVLIGNKNDLKNERVIMKEIGEEKAKVINIKYFETSAVTGEGINEAFEYLAKLILKKKNPDAYLNKNISLTKKDAKDLLDNKKTNKCC